MEAAARERVKCFLVFQEQFTDTDPLFIMKFGRFCLMRIKKPAVVGLYVIERFRRDEKVASFISNLAFHISFFPAGPWITEPGFKVVVRPKLCEQCRFMNDAAQFPAHAGCIVKHDRSGHAANIVKDVQQALADTLSSFAAKHLAVPVIAERERQNKELFADRHSVFDKVSFPEIRLCRAGFPDEFLIRPLFHLVAADALDITLDNGVTAGKTMFIHKTVEYTLRCMALFVPVVFIRLQP